MPGKGKAIARPWTSEERAAIGQRAEAAGLSAEEAPAQPGDEAVDVYLNGVAYWRGVHFAEIDGVEFRPRQGSG